MKRWFNMKKGRSLKNEAGETLEVAEVSIFDEIGFWGVTAGDFKRELDSLGNVSQINVSIHSPGGEVLEGWAIYNLLKNHKATVHVHVVGMAASIASIIALAGDEIVMNENSYMMIHRVSNFAWGDAEEIQRSAEITQQFENDLVAAYIAKSGLPEEEIREMMRVETWMSGAEAVAKGFATSVLEKQEAAAKASPQWTNRFAQIPDGLIDKSTKVLGNTRTKPDTDMSVKLKAAKDAFAKAKKAAADAKASAEAAELERKKALKNLKALQEEEEEDPNAEDDEEDPTNQEDDEDPDAELDDDPDADPDDDDEDDEPSTAKAMVAMQKELKALRAENKKRDAEIAKLKTGVTANSNRGKTPTGDPPPANKKPLTGLARAAAKRKAAV